MDASGATWWKTRVKQWDAYGLIQHVDINAL